VHRNTFIDSPKCLAPTLEFRGRPGLFFAGQMTGVEGYVESTAGGLVAGLNAVRALNGRAPVMFPITTAIGALMAYIGDPERKHFQPMNINFGLIPAYADNVVDAKRKKGIGGDKLRLRVAENAIADLKRFLGGTDAGVEGAAKSASGALAL
jgi:methylenetetrahydrofolate--tRNA-(uracil-5-)-methyltransferase